MKKNSPKNPYHLFPKLNKPKIVLNYVNHCSNNYPEPINQYPQQKFPRKAPANFPQFYFAWITKVARKKGVPRFTWKPRGSHPTKEVPPSNIPRLRKAWRENFRRIRKRNKNRDNPEVSVLRVDLWERDGLWEVVGIAHAHREGVNLREGFSLFPPLEYFRGLGNKVYIHSQLKPTGTIPTTIGY